MKGNAEPVVLVVEDESALSTLLRYNLEREGYRVFEAKDGEEALLLADEAKPDLVLLDSFRLSPLLCLASFSKGLQQPSSVLF